MLDNFKNSFNGYIIGNNKNQVSEEDTKRFLANEVKYINSFRDEFFEKIDIQKNQKANLVEIINEFSENYYSAAIQIESTVYLYNGYHAISQDGSLLKRPSKFEKIDLETFLTHKGLYGIKPCIIDKMINNQLDDLLDDIITTRYHYTVYISKIKDVHTIETKILKHICF